MTLEMRTPFTGIFGRLDMFGDMVNRSREYATRSEGASGNVLVLQIAGASKTMCIFSVSR